MSANILRTLRKQKGLTLVQVAEQTGLSVPYLSDLERARKPISKRASSLLEAFYDVEARLFYVSNMDAHELQIDRDKLKKALNTVDEMGSGTMVYYSQEIQEPYPEEIFISVQLRGDFLNVCVFRYGGHRYPAMESAAIRAMNRIKGIDEFAEE